MAIGDCQTNITTLNALAGARFDGVDDSIGIYRNPLTNYPFTLSLWMRNYKGTTGGIALYIGSSSTADSYFHIGMDISGAACIGRNTTAYRSYSDNYLLDRKWHHLVGVFSSSIYRKFYLDGVGYTANTESVPYFTSNCIQIGFTGDSSPSGWVEGNIRDVRIYDVSLTDSQILDLYNSKDIRENLVHQFKLANNFNDEIDSSYLGVISGAYLGIWDDAIPTTLSGAVAALIPQISGAYSPTISGSFMFAGIAGSQILSSVMRNT